MHIFLTFLCLATVSTISLETATTSSVPPEFSAFCRRINNPHSFSANAASSTRRLVARAISDRVHRMTTCAVALPSGFGVVSTVRSDVNIGSKQQHRVDHQLSSHRRAARSRTRIVVRLHYTAARHEVLPIPAFRALAALHLRGSPVLWLSRRRHEVGIREVRHSAHGDHFRCVRRQDRQQAAAAHPCRIQSAATFGAYM